MGALVLNRIHASKNAVCFLNVLANETAGDPDELVHLLKHFLIIYLQYVRPHDDASSVLIETCNEVILLVICYHFILLTDLISDPFLKFKIGLSLIVCVCLMIALNLSIIVFVSLRQLCYDLRKKRALRL